METKNTVAVNGVTIEYSLSEKAVHINNNDKLKSVITNPQTAIKLAKKLKENYYMKYGNDLSVSELSMAIEIYGHVYPEKIVTTLKGMPLPGAIEHAIDEVLKKTDIIDSGEASIDGNRKVWDAIAKVIPV